MVKYMRIFIVLAAVAAGTCALSAQTVTVRTEHTVSADRGRYESRREVRCYSSRDFWKAERWSVRAGMATPSYTASTFAEGSLWKSPWRNSTSRSLSDIYADYNGITRSSGALCLGADYAFARWFALSVDLSATIVWHDVYNGVSGRKTGSKSGVMFSLMPQGKLIYINRPTVRLYGRLGLGVVKYFGFDRRNRESADDGIEYLDNSFTPGFQWTPLGIEVGRKVFGFAETGIGTLYTGISAGVGYKF